MRRQQLTETQITALFDVSWYATTHYLLRTSQRSGAVVAIIIASATPSCFAIYVIRAVR